MMLSHYIALTKPRITNMVLVTTALGYYLGGRGWTGLPGLLVTLLGVAMGSGGAAVLNNYLERDFDARMDRTRNRALPSGAVPPLHALVLGTTLVIAGVMLLVSRVNLLTGFLVLLAAFLYVLVYTPLKRVTWFNTPVGAVPGAIPPMVGWAAAAGNLDAGAWVLFAILFLWQHPHFYAIAWMFKEDYRRGGFKMLPENDPTGARTFRHVMVHCALLIAVSVLPTVFGLTGVVYVGGVVAIGLAFAAAGLALARSGALPDARRLLRASVIYLPVWLLLTVVDLTF
jgi:protoheme IX farnesyltransferase